MQTPTPSPVQAALLLLLLLAAHPLPVLVVAAETGGAPLSWLPMLLLTQDPPLHQQSRHRHHHHHLLRLHLQGRSHCPTAAVVAAVALPLLPQQRSCCLPQHCCLPQLTAPLAAPCLLLWLLLGLRPHRLWQQITSRWAQTRCDCQFAPNMLSVAHTPAVCLYCQGGCAVLLGCCSIPAQAPHQ